MSRGARRAGSAPGPAWGRLRLRPWIGLRRRGRRRSGRRALGRRRRRPGTAQILGEILLTAACGVLCRGIASDMLRVFRNDGEAVGDACSDAGDLLDGRRDHRRDRARTAMSALSAIETALSVTVSGLSSWSLTRSTVPPVLTITGSRSRSVPLMNEESRSKAWPSLKQHERRREPDARPGRSRAPVGGVAGSEGERSTSRGSYPVAPTITPAPTTASAS